MQIIQLLPSLSFGDAVGNDALALQTLLTRMGYSNRIYAENISPRYLEAGVATYASSMPAPAPEDILLYHLSTGSALHKIIPSFPCKKIAIYHNITPSSFFFGNAKVAYGLTTDAYTQVFELRHVFDYILADSQYNKVDLLHMGFTCPIDVLPILIPFEDYHRPPALSVARRYADGGTNLLFVGRVAPNKKHEDIIAAYAAYKQNFDANARLFLVGSSDGMEHYAASLRAYMRTLGLCEKDVIFSGHISFAEILGFYSTADLFLCLSEHEGFCVPLVEAMLFDVPIVAYASSAIAETLGGAGILLEEKAPLTVACAMHRVLTDPALRATLQEKAHKRLEDFSTQTVSKQFEALLAAFLKGTK